MPELFHVTPDLSIPQDEIELRFSRSAGPGGQKVNKTSTRVELFYNVATSKALSDEQRALLLARLGRQLDSRGALHLAADEYASQWRNRQEVLARFREVLRQALQVPKRRVPTHPSRAVIERRLEHKRRRAQVKRQRRVTPRDW